MNMGFYIGIILGPLLNALCRIHVLWAYQIILTAAHMDQRIQLQTEAVRLLQEVRLEV